MTRAVLWASGTKQFHFEMTSFRAINTSETKVTNTFTLVTGATIAAIVWTWHFEFARCTGPAFMAVTSAQHTNATAIAVCRFTRHHISAVSPTPASIANTNTVLAMPILRTTLTTRH